MKRFPPMAPTRPPAATSSTALRAPDPVHIRRSDVRALCGALPTFVWVDDRELAVRSGNACAQCLRLDLGGAGIGNAPKLPPPAPPPARPVAPGRYREMPGQLEGRGTGERIARALLGEIAAQLHRDVLEPFVGPLQRDAPRAAPPPPPDERRGPVIDVECEPRIAPLCAHGKHDICSGHLCACSCHKPRR